MPKHTSSSAPLAGSSEKKNKTGDSSGSSILSKPNVKMTTARAIRNGVSDLMIDLCLVIAGYCNDITIIAAYAMESNVTFAIGSGSKHEEDSPWKIASNRPVSAEGCWTRMVRNCLATCPRYSVMCSLAKLNADITPLIELQVVEDDDKHPSLDLVRGETYHAFVGEAKLLNDSDGSIRATGRFHGSHHIVDVFRDGCWWNHAAIRQKQHDIDIKLNWSPVPCVLAPFVRRWHRAEFGEFDAHDVYIALTYNRMEFWHIHHKTGIATKLWASPPLAINVMLDDPVVLPSSTDSSCRLLLGAHKDWSLLGLELTHHEDGTKTDGATPSLVVTKSTNSTPIAIASAESYAHPVHMPHAHRLFMLGWKTVVCIDTSIPLAIQTIALPETALGAVDPEYFRHAVMVGHDVLFLNRGPYVYRFDLNTTTNLWEYTRAVMALPDAVMGLVAAIYD